MTGQRDSVANIGHHVIEHSDGPVYVQIENHYRGTRHDPGGMVELGNRLNICTDLGDLVDLPLTRRDCLQIGLMMVEAATREDSWPAGDPNPVRSPE